MLCVGRDVKRLGFIQAITLAAGVTGAVVLAGGWLVSLLGCGDVVPPPARAG